MLTSWFAGAGPSGVARERPARTAGTMCDPESETADAWGVGPVAVATNTSDGTTKTPPVMSPTARRQRLRIEPEAEPRTERRLLARWWTGRDGTFSLLRGTRSRRMRIQDVRKTRGLFRTCERFGLVTRRKQRTPVALAD